MKAAELIKRLQQLPPDTDVPLAALAEVLGASSPAEIYARMANADRNPNNVIAHLMSLK